MRLVSTAALARSSVVDVRIAEIAVRSNRERDWQDVALLLSLLPDPVAEGQRCTARDRRRLRHVLPLLDRNHVAWIPLGDDHHRRGASALELLLNN